MVRGNHDEKIIATYSLDEELALVASNAERGTRPEGKLFADSDTLLHDSKQCGCCHLGFKRIYRGAIVNAFPKRIHENCRKYAFVHLPKASQYFGKCCGIQIPLSFGARHSVTLPVLFGYAVLGQNVTNDRTENFYGISLPQLRQ